MNTFSNPIDVINQLHIFSGQKCADLGAGSGAYAFALAQKVAGNEEGRVYAVDIQKDMLERLGLEAKERGIANIEVVWGDAEQPNGSRLRDESIDIVVIANTLFQSHHQADLIAEAFRILKPSGTFLIVDWSESYGSIGPREDHVITAEHAQQLAENNGFMLDRAIPAGEHHYALIFNK